MNLQSDQNKTTQGVQFNASEDEMPEIGKEKLSATLSVPKVI